LHYITVCCHCSARIIVELSLTLTGCDSDTDITLLRDCNFFYKARRRAVRPVHGKLIGPISACGVCAVRAGGRNLATRVAARPARPCVGGARRRFSSLDFTPLAARPIHCRDVTHHPAASSMLRSLRIAARDASHPLLHARPANSTFISTDCMFFIYLKVVWKSDYDLQIIILLSELKNRQQTTSIIQQPTIVA